VKDWHEMLERITGVIHDADVNKVFGNPRELGGRTLIPVAEVSYGFGAGYGVTESGEETELSEKPGEELEETAATGAGGGGGAGARVRPLAYIEVGSEGTTITPIEDEQKITLAGILLAAWIFGWIGLVIKEIFD
jgi:uncharacterized spore protein YtfJ